MKKQLSLLLVASFLSSLVACGGGETVWETSASDVTSNTSQSAETSLTDRLAAADYNGYNFRILGETQTVGSDYFDVEEETGDVIGDAVYSRNRAVEEKYNIKLSFSYAEQWKGADAISTAILSGENSFDLCTCTHLTIGKLLISNYFVDWQDVKSIDLSLPCYVADANTTYSIGNAMPLLFGDFMETNTLRCWNFIFNHRLANEYNITDLYTTVDDGKCTIGYLKTLIRDVSRDLDGNTTFDENDFYGFATDRLATLDAFTRPCGIYAISKDKDNMPVLSFWKENTAKAFEEVYDLYYNCAGTYATKDSLGHMLTVFPQGRAIFASTRIDYIMRDEMRDMEDNYGVLPYPKLDETQTEYATYLSGTFSAQMIPVTQNSADWERTGIITQALNAYAHELVLPMIYETTLKTKLTRDEDSARMMDIILNNRRYSFDSMDESNFSLSPIKTIRTLIGSQGNADIASYYESNRESAEKWIQNMIDAFADANS